jgi:hypothetical protein
MEAQPFDMNRCLDGDITTSRVWQEEQVDRLLGFEILTRTLRAKYQPIDPAILADKIGLDKGTAFRIVQQIKLNLNERQ